MVHATITTRERIEELYQAHGPALLAYAVSFTADRQQAEDVLHHVFTKLIEGSAHLPEPPRPYLFRAVHNAALNTQRWWRRHTALVDDDPLFVSATADRESAIALQRALGELPRDQRQVVILRIWGELTLEECADVVGASPNTVASRYRYALAKLREKLAGAEEK